MADETKKIYAPRNWVYTSVLDFVERLHLLKDCDSLQIDFSQLYFARPFGILWVAEGIRDVVKFRNLRGKKTSAVGLDGSSTAQSFLMHVGFFQFSGLDIGKALGEAIPNRNYLPITLVKGELFDATGDVAAQIQAYSGSLTRIVMGLGQDAPIPRHPVRYCFREIIRNVFEHSEAGECLLMAQWYARRELEIAILDRGIGIGSSLGKKFSISNDEQAIVLALQPGISKADLEDDDAVNSGFGLYAVSELGRRTGVFSIVSGSAGITLFEGERRFRETSFSGTGIRLVVEKPQDQDPAVLLNQIIDEGEKVSESKGGKGASKWSKEL